MNEEMMDEEELAGQDYYDVQMEDQSGPSKTGKQASKKGRGGKGGDGKSQCSQNSGIRLGKRTSDHGSHYQNEFEENLEEEELLQRELGDCGAGEMISQSVPGSHQKTKHANGHTLPRNLTPGAATESEPRKDSTCQNTTAETITNPSGMVPVRSSSNEADSQTLRRQTSKNGNIKPKNGRPLPKLQSNPGNSVKSLKQSNLAGWVNNSSQATSKQLATGSTAQNLVGQKRLKCEGQDGRDEKPESSRILDNLHGSTANLKDHELHPQSKRQNTDDFSPSRERQISEFKL